MKNDRDSGPSRRAVLAALRREMRRELGPDWGALWRAEMDRDVPDWERVEIVVRNPEGVVVDRIRVLMRGGFEGEGRRRRR